MPTTVDNTIGSTGTYSTPTAWEVDTDNNHVTADEHHRGLLQSQAHALGTTRLQINGSTTSATQFREMVPDDGAIFDPEAETGAHLTYSGTLGALHFIEANFRFGGGIGIIMSGGATGEVILTQVADQVTDGVTIINRCTGTLTYGIEGSFTAAGLVARNVIYIHDTTSAMTAVFTDLNEVSNCTTHAQQGSFTRMSEGNASKTQIVKNCAAFGSSGDPFDANTTATTCTSDFAIAGGEGTGSLTDTDEFTDPANSDYSLKDTGSSYQNGADLSADFLLDYNQDTRDTWDIGALAHADSIPATSTNGPAVLTAAAATMASSGVETMEGATAPSAGAATMTSSGSSLLGAVGAPTLVGAAATMASSGSAAAEGSAPLETPAALLNASGTLGYTGTSGLTAPAATFATTAASGTPLSVVKSFAAWLCGKTGQDDSMYLANKRTLQYTVGSLADEAVVEDLTPYGDIKWTLSRISPSGQILTASPVVEKKLSDLTLSATLVSGIVNVPLLNEDTEALQPGTYHMELELFDVFGEAAVVATGTMTLVANVENT